MRAKSLLALLPVLALVGCGAAKTVSPEPKTVIGSTPTQTSPPPPPPTQPPPPPPPSTGGSGVTTIGGGSPSGKIVFEKNGCGSCHTFKAAGATAKIGPDLDKLAQYAKQANQPLDKFVQESIVNPKAYVQPGFQPIMPSFASLSKAEVDALVAYLTKGT